MGEIVQNTDEEVVDAISEAIENAEGGLPSKGESEEPKEEPKEEPESKESKEPEEPAKKAEKEEGALEEPKLPEEALESEEDRTANFVAKLEAAGLHNQAEQAQRWYTQLQEAKAEREELRQFKEERAAQEAETAERRSKADDILENAPADLKSAWGKYRQENGDRAFINAHKRYLEKLRKESPEDYEKETAAAERRELARALEQEKQERERLEKERDRREYLTERDSTLRSLQIDPKDFEVVAERVDGAYVTQYMKLKDQGLDPEGLKVSEVATKLITEMKEERERIKKLVREEIQEEARENKKKKRPRRRAEEAPPKRGRRAKDIDDEATDVIRGAIVDSFEGTG